MEEVLIYFVIAAIVCGMLYFVLGKQVGEAPDAFKSDPFLSSGDKPLDKEVVAPQSIHFEGPAGEGLGAIASADTDFNPDQFLSNSKTAYSMVLDSYADGDLETLELLLSKEMFAAYKEAIAQRENKGLSQTTDMARIVAAQFITASRIGKTGSIAVEYEADIAAALIDESGEVVEGDIDTLSRVKEVWTYERRLASNNPNWILVSVEEAGEDTFGSAPDFKPDS